MLVLAIAALLSLSSAAPARADVAIGGPPPEVLSGAALFDATSGDGRRVVFSSRRRLARGDRDRVLDVYLREGGRTRLLSAGPSADEAVRFVTATPDARTVFFRTAARLSSADTDSAQDIYRHGPAGLELISFGAADPARLHAASADGRRMVISTSAALDPADVDGSPDLYSYEGGRAALVSAGSGVRFLAASADATRVYFESDGRLWPLDLDSSEAKLAAISADGRRAFFVNRDPFAQLAGDTHCALYERWGTRTTLASVVRGRPFPVDCEAERIMASKDGSAVVFSIAAGGRRDQSGDLYRRQRGRTALVSAPSRPFSGQVGAFLEHVSADGSRVVFLTWRPLVPRDTDGGYDIYSRGPRGFTLISIGPVGGNGAHFGPPGSLIGDVFPQFGGASDDGRRVFFSTEERLLRHDRNDETDLYERGPAGLRLVSTRSCHRCAGE